MTIESQLDTLIDLARQQLDATRDQTRLLKIALSGALTVETAPAPQSAETATPPASSGIAAVRESIAASRPAVPPLPVAEERPRPTVPNNPPPMPTEIEHSGGRPIGSGRPITPSAPREPAAPATARPDMPSLDIDEDPAAGDTAAVEADEAEDMPALQTDAVERPDSLPRIQGDEPSPLDDLRYGQPSAKSAVIQINGVDDLDKLNFDKAKSILISYCGEHGSLGYRERVDLLKNIYGEQKPAIEGETPALLKDVDPSAYGNVVRELAIKIAVYNARNNVHIPDDIQTPAF